MARTPHHLHTEICHFGGECHRLLREIIDYYDLIGTPALRKDALDAANQQMGAVACRDHHADAFIDHRSEAILVRSVTRPNLFIVGAPKSGTTTLYHWLRSVPDVFMSPLKEPYFYSCLGAPPSPPEGRPPEYRAKNQYEYDALFASAGPARVVGEASPSYLVSENAAGILRRRHPKARYVAILRDPVLRAYSHFLHKKRLGTEPAPSLRDAVELERERREKNWDTGWLYVANGLYAENLARYSFVPTENLRVYLYEDLATRPDWLLRDLVDFLGVSMPDIDTSRAYNSGGLYRSGAVGRITSKAPKPIKTLGRLLRPGTRARLADTLDRLNRKQPPPLDAETVEWLRPRFSDDIRRLEEMLGRDLSSWLVGRP